MPVICPPSHGRFTVATIGTQLERKGDADGAATRYFGSCMALVFLWTPVLGLLSDRVGFALTLAMTNTLLLAAMACAPRRERSKARHASPRTAVV